MSMAFALPHRSVAAWSSIVLRFFSFFFLRWIPGHPFPPIIYSSFIAYAISVYFYTTQPFSSSNLMTTANGMQDPKKKNAQSRHGQPNGDFTTEDMRRTNLELRDSLKVLLFGIPSRFSGLWNSVAFGINSLLVISTVYYVFAPTVVSSPDDLSFARVGYVSENSANIFTRIPSIAVSGALTYRLAESGKQYGKTYEVSAFSREITRVMENPEHTDWTASTSITRLTSDTRYHFNISYFGNQMKLIASQEGHFVTAPRVGSFSQRGNGTFSFLSTSCLIQNFPFNPLAHPLSIHGFRYLSQTLSKLRPAFMLFLGDFIYIDVPRRHGTDLKSYRREYRQVYASPDWPSAAMVYPNPEPKAIESNYAYDLPWIHTYDDHEIANDWSSNTTGYFRNAFDAYLNYHVKPNPALPGGAVETASPDPQSSTSPFTISDKTPTYTSFIQGPVSFYLMDTRRYRRTPSPHKNTTMLGSQQLKDLLGWLRAPTPRGVTWKVVASSVPFTKNWRMINTDMWAAHTAERRIILEAMWDYASVPGAAGVVVLSGDRHEFTATAFPPPDGVASRTGPASRKPRWHPRGTVYEFSASPLSQFYLPFFTYRSDKPRAASGDGGKIELAAEQEESDVCIKYINKGNSKFGFIEVEPPTADGVSVLRYKLFVDGKETWSYELSSGGFASK